MIPALIGLPFDAKSSFLRGAADGPRAIREALYSSSTNLWSESGRDLGAVDALRDWGDLPLTEDDFLRAIPAALDPILMGGDRPIALGGDHSVTYPILVAVGARHPGVTIIHIDAHADLYPDYEGDPYSHACPFARIMEEHLAARLVQIGIRTLNRTQRDQGERFGVDVIDMRRWVAGDRPSVSGPVYLSVDLDAFDPAFAPGVSHREPGGLSPREILTFIQSLESPIVGADIVELNPSRDPLGITAPLAAKLVKEIADRMLER